MPHQLNNGVTNHVTQQRKGETVVEGLWFPGQEIDETSADAASSRLHANSCSGPDVRVWFSKKKGRMCGTIRTASELYEPDVARELLVVEELDIEDDEESFKIIPPEMATMVKLRMLTMKWTMLKFLTPSLTCLKLTHLYMPHNRLISLDGITAMRTLEVLDVSFNSLVALPDEIGNLQSLKELVVSGNKLKELPENVTSCRYLVELNVTSNKLTALPETIGRLKRLQLLDASMNFLTSLPDSTGELVNLVDLRASGNRLWQLPATLQNAVSIRSMTFRRNRLREVPRVTCFLPNLQMLNVRDNLIEEVEGGMVHLKQLLLDSNRLASIPPTITQCKNLELLSLEHNRIEDIPTEIAKLTRLRALYVGHNQIEYVPPEIGRLLQLRHLSLQYNRIQTLPCDVQLLRRLSVLNLEYTNIDGAWMSAYRQGVPALLAYAESVRDSGPLRPQIGQRKRSPATLSNPRLTPPASPVVDRGWAAETASPGRSRARGNNGRRSPSPIEMSLMGTRDNDAASLAGTASRGPRPTSPSFVGNWEVQSLRSTPHTEHERERPSSRASVNSSSPNWTTNDNVGSPSMNRRNGRSSICDPEYSSRVSSRTSHGLARAGQESQSFSGCHNMTERKPQSYLMETRKKRLPRTVDARDQSGYDVG